MVTPENEHSVAMHFTCMSIASRVLDLVLWSRTCSVEGDLQLATRSGASPSRYVGGEQRGLGEDQIEKDGACDSRNEVGSFEVG